MKKTIAIAIGLMMIAMFSATFAMSPASTFADEEDGYYWDLEGDDVLDEGEDGDEEYTEEGNEEYTEEGDEEYTEEGDEEYTEEEITGDEGTTPTLTLPNDDSEEPVEEPDEPQMRGTDPENTDESANNTDSHDNIDNSTDSHDNIYNISDSHDNIDNSTDSHDNINNSTCKTENNYFGRYCYWVYDKTARVLDDNYEPEKYNYTNTSSPKTGDSFPIQVLLGAAMAVISLIVAAVVLKRRSAQSF